MSKRKICVVTGTRAEYGSLYWLLREIQADDALQLQLAVTGMHLSPEFGLTIRDIEADGFAVDERVEMLLSSDTPVGIAKSVGIGVIGFADAFARLQPDVVVVLGDRFEILAAAQAALVARIPIAHLHGGETTEGVFDEAIRHSITKMAHLHFVAAEPYRRRVIQLGEAPSRVWNVGAPGLDHLRRTRLLDRAAFEHAIDFDLGEPTFLVTYHPATLSERSPGEAARELLRALDRFASARILFTKTNADTGGRVINEMIDAYVAEHSERARAFTSLGQQRYLSALNLVNLVIGNSSSGVIEAPAFNVPTVNIGPRQQGRLRAVSVVDCSVDADDIATAIERALSNEFKASLQDMKLPYGQGDTAQKIASVLRESILGEGLLMKRFFDVAWDDESEPVMAGQQVGDLA
jgi:UDP-N-acetylglucosamine 2-epimerase (non-hydrolysing)/GDP/UDP-N,N'-diacetylbacillosamine 2-epimerase (hydrolysing)